MKIDELETVVKIHDLHRFKNSTRKNILTPFYINYLIQINQQMALDLKEIVGTLIKLMKLHLVIIIG